MTNHTFIDTTSLGNKPNKANRLTMMNGLGLSNKNASILIDRHNLSIGSCALEAIQRDKLVTYKFLHVQHSLFISSFQRFPILTHTNLVFIQKSLLGE